MGRVLVVDDEVGIRDALEVLIRCRSHVVFTAADLESALAWLEKEVLDLVITDLRLGVKESGLDVIRAARKRPNPPEVIVMTAFGSRENARQAVEQGASFYLEKGPHLASDIEVLVSQAINSRRLKEENESLRRALVGAYGVGGIVGKSEPIREVLDLVERIAPTSVTVLITGESGTGKERIARALHHASPRAARSFVPLNCGAIPENLIEAELFGHTKGAFTGADEAKDGLFVAAEAGTIFLDEIAELPLRLQPKLLRVLQEKKVKPIGANEERDVDVRVLAATNRDLEDEVEKGRFRADLYYRLKVVEVDLPPLRQRKEDIPLLAATFLEKYSREYRREVSRIDPRAMECLLAFRYPGNVRQLENVIERAVALATGSVLTLDALPRELRTEDAPPPRVYALEGEVEFPDEGIELDRLVEEFELGLITRALEKAGGVKTKAAELLGLTFRQFRYKLTKYERKKETADLRLNGEGS